jgi:RND family efflux transporter MFP subunit
MMLKVRVAITAITLTLAANGVFAHGDEDHSQDGKKPTVAAVALVSSSAPQRLADGSLFVPKPVQRQLDIRTIAVRGGDLAASIELNGKVIPNPDAGGRIQATQPGSVLPGSRGMPLPGSKVSKGEVLAYLRPVGGAIERGNQQAQQAELEALLAVAEGRVRRFEQLEGAVPQKEIEAARIERDALRKRRAFVSASINTAEPLIAPVSGVISASNVVAGQVVEMKEILFEIVDPARLAVEALAYDAGLASSIVGASALADNAVALDLKFIGGGRQLREQALPLLFSITTRDTSVAVGQPVKVMVRTARGIKGAAVPRQALTKNSAGETAVWVHAEAERFVARKVRVQPLDANQVAVTEGLHDGDRVVVEGAGLLSQVR